MSCSVLSLKQTMYDVLWWMSSLPNEILKLHSKNIILVYDLISNLKMFMSCAFTTKTSQSCTNNKKKTKYNVEGERNHTLASSLVTKWYCAILAIFVFYSLKILAYSITLAMHLFRFYKTLKEIELLFCDIYKYS